MFCSIISREIVLVRAELVSVFESSRELHPCPTLVKLAGSCLRLVCWTDGQNGPGFYGGALFLLRDFPSASGWLEYSGEVSQAVQYMWQLV